MQRIPHPPAGIPIHPGNHHAHDDRARPKPPPQPRDRKTHSSSLAESRSDQHHVVRNNDNTSGGVSDGSSTVIRPAG